MCISRFREKSLAEKDRKAPKRHLISVYSVQTPEFRAGDEGQQLLPEALHLRPGAGAVAGGQDIAGILEGLEELFFITPEPGSDIGKILLAVEFPDHRSAEFEVHPPLHQQ